MIGNQPKTAGIVKHVHTDSTEEEIIEELNDKYPDCEVDFFKRNNRFTGTLKIKFNKEEELKHAIDNCVTISQHRYVVEEYIFRPRVIRCNKCQAYGHLERLCLNERTVCGKCKSEEHETRECEETVENYKCYHCNGNHQTGYKECAYFKEKEDAIKERFHNV